MQPHEEEALRARIHKLSDQVQVHEVRMGEQGIMLQVLSNHYEALRQSTATKDNLEAVALQTKQHIDTSIAGVTKDVSNLSDKLAPIQRGIYWVLTVVLGAVLLALLGLVLKGVATG